ncbi:MAG: PfkB family carbohydrate kinase [Dehalococcoidia bacterium]|jgi:ribokinase|nr:PfkB family carbohydrate kinase [Dehalococcoidia bacterium]
MAKVLVSGAINWDTLCLVEHLPAPGEEVTCDAVSEVPGGTGANTAVAAARILGPGEVALFAALGQDDIADRQLAVLDTEGVVRSSVVRMPGQSSGHAYIFVDHTGQNVIASDLGANTTLSTRHARPARLSTLLQDCRCVVLSDPPLPVAAHLLQAAADRDIPALWDPGVLARHGWTVLAPLARHVDSLFLNEAEARQLFGAAAPRDMVMNLDRRNAPAHIVLKLGARGSLLVDCATGETAAIPALPMIELGLHVVSAVGCGDVFIGACAACLALGYERRTALLMASAAAGFKATRPETRGGPDMTTLLSLYQRAAQFGFALAGDAGAPR